MSKECHLDKNIFGGPREVAVASPNVHQVLRTSSDELKYYVQLQYGQRAGHIPLDGVDRSMVLVPEINEAISGQYDYLSSITGREIKPVIESELKRKLKGKKEPSLIVSYINVPEASKYTEEKLGGESWGLPAGIVDKLKNKAWFHEKIEKLHIEGLHVPDFEIVEVSDLKSRSLKFLKKIDGLYNEHEMFDYKRGLVLRPDECDGGYGMAMVMEDNGHKVFLPDGKKAKEQRYNNWEDALGAAEGYVKEAFGENKGHVVVSRLIDLVDSPGMSVVLMDGKVESLGWNGQIQANGAACEGTANYKPKDKYLESVKDQNEEKMATAFGEFLRKCADEQGVDFGNILGVGNIDIMIPGDKERQLQKKRWGCERLYLAESNPRWTNYTDAGLLVVAVNKMPQTIRSMKRVVKNGIETQDKYKLPEGLDPREVREKIYKRNMELQEEGTLLIARMTVKPEMGVIYAGNVPRAKREMTDIVEILTNKK